MATQDVTVGKKSPAQDGLKTSVPLDRYHVYTSEGDANYPFKTGARQPEFLVVLYVRKDSTFVPVKATLDTSA